MKCLNECECCECAYVSFYVFFSFSVSVDCPGSEDEDDPAVEGVTGLVAVLAIEDGESSTHMSLEKEIAIIAEYKRALLSAGYDFSSASSLDSENGEKIVSFNMTSTMIMMMATNIQKKSFSSRSTNVFRLVNKSTALNSVGFLFPI